MSIYKEYFRLNEEEETGLDEVIQSVDTNVKISEADIVIDPDGMPIDMRAVRGIMGDAIDALIKMVDESLADYFSNLEIVYTYNNCATFQTDGMRFAVNPTFFMNVYLKGRNASGPDEDRGLAYIAFILLHECFHVMLGHCEDPRVIDLIYKGELEKDRTNYAMDAVINWMIENATYDSIDDEYVFKNVTKEIGGVYSEKYSRMDWPEVYDNVSDEEVMDSMDQVLFKHIDPLPEDKVDEWYDGFLDGYNEFLEKMRADNLVESACKIYINPVLEAGGSKNDLVAAILNDKSKTPQEKADMIYSLLGDDINGDEEANDDDDTGSNGFGSSGGSNGSGGSSSTGDDDISNMSEYEQGKIYGLTFAAYTFNCSGNPDYVKEHIFPAIKLPDVPPMKKKNNNIRINIGAVIDLGAITDELLKNKNVKVI